MFLCGALEKKHEISEMQPYVTICILINCGVRNFILLLYFVTHSPVDTSSLMRSVWNPHCVSFLILAVSCVVMSNRRRLDVSQSHFLYMMYDSCNLA